MIARLFARLLMGMVRLYQVTLAYWLGGRCRFQPSCSQYAHEALARHGAWNGLNLAVTRIVSCRPNGGSGFDPVPASPLRQHTSRSQDRSH